MFLELVLVRSNHLVQVTGFDFVECKYLERFFAKIAAGVFRACFCS